MLTHLLQSTLFAAAIFLLTLALRHNSARVRQRLWLVASLKFLIPFLLLASLGSQLPWAPLHRITRTVIMIQETSPQGGAFLPVSLTAPKPLPKALRRGQRPQLIRTKSACCALLKR